MATAKKTTTAPASKKASKAAAPVKAAAKSAAKSAAKTPAQPAVKAATKRAVKAAAKPAVAATKRAAKAPAKTAAIKMGAAKPAAAAKPIKTAFNKTGLVAYLAELAAVELKAAKALMAALESTILMSIHKKGLGSFTLPGLMKITALAVPAKKKRMGKDPFTGQERMFAAKPATTKIKTRALKKLKDAAL